MVLFLPRGLHLHPILQRRSPLSAVGEKHFPHGVEERGLAAARGTSSPGVGARALAFRGGWFAGDASGQALRGAPRGGCTNLGYRVGRSFLGRLGMSSRDGESVQDLMLRQQYEEQERQRQQQEWVCQEQERQRREYAAQVAQEQARMAREAGTFALSTYSNQRCRGWLNTVGTERPC